MARATVVSGATFTTNNSYMFFTGAGLIPPDLVDGGGVGYLRDIRITRASGVRNVLLRIGSTQSESISGTGPDLTPAWENNATALTVIRHRGSATTEIVIPGPGSALRPDTSDPYDWQPQNVSAVRAFAAAHGRGDTYDIVLDDGIRYVPSLKIGGELVQSLKIGSELVGIIKIGSEIAYRAD